jgi:UDP-glucose 4-epimerase
MIGRDSHVLVTGGAGFIGSHLVEHLVYAGACVTVIDNLATGRMDDLQALLPQIELVLGDLSDILRLKRVTLDDYDYVFHLAANPYIPPSVDNPRFDFHANLNNTFNLLEALRIASRRPRLVNVSSAAVYGNPTRLPITETDPTVPISPYGVSKLAGERYAEVYSRLYGLQATSVRLFSVYGPRQRKQVVFDLLARLREDATRLTVLGDGSQERDFVYVLDVVQAMMLAAEVAPGHGECYNVASGTTHSIRQLVATWCEVCSLAPEVVYTGHVRPGDAEKWAVDITSLGRLGFKPRTLLAEGLAAIRDWYDTISG